MTIAAFRWLLNDEPASGWCDGPPSACQLAAAQDTGSVRWTPQYAYHGPVEAATARPPADAPAAINPAEPFSKSIDGAPQQAGGEKEK